MAEPYNHNPNQNVHPCPTIEYFSLASCSWPFSRHSSSNMGSWVTDPHNGFPLALQKACSLPITNTSCTLPKLQIYLSLRPPKSLQSFSSTKTGQHPYRALTVSPPNYSSHAFYWPQIMTSRDTESCKQHQDPTDSEDCPNVPSS